MADSFYGGKQGFSFILTKSFGSVDEMIANFAKGPAYTDVRFDEYVIINSGIKNVSTNGRIYRRGYDYSNDTGGAIYIGTILGPAGPAPWMEYLETPEAVKAIADTVQGEDKTEGEIVFDISNTNLIPGKDGDTYTDSIKGYYCTIRTSAIDSNANDNDKTVYIGFKIPYTVFNFTASPVNAYTTNNLITNNSTAAHPFYSNWNIKIPKGKKGDSIEKLRIITPTIADNIQTIDATHATELQTAITNRTEVLVCDFRNYESSEAGSKASTFYIGSWDTIKDISLTDTGKFSITYTGNKAVYNKTIKWPTKAALDLNTGIFSITYNDSTHTDSKLIWPKQASLNVNTGIFRITYSDGTYQDSKMKWPKEATLNKDTGDFRVVYNDSSVTTSKLNWPTEATLDKETGIFNVTYVDGTNVQSQLKWPQEVTMSATDQKISVIYSDNTLKEISPSINYIEDTVIRTDNYHYLVRYSSGKMAALQESGQILVTYRGQKWVDLGSVRSYDGVLVGLNLPEASAETGDISTQSRALSYLNSHYIFGLGYDNNGNKIDDQLAGKIVAIGNNSLSKQMYAYNYGTFGNTASSTQHWFYLGTAGSDVSINGEMIQMVYENPSNWQDTEFVSKTNTLADGGIWWILES